MSTDADTAGPPDHAAGFSLDVGAGLREMRDWVHGFAAGTIRPAAAEWDEREETPWPVLEEAAKVGLYSLDFFGQQWLEPSGLGTKPPPLGFEARGVWPSSVFPIDESFVEAFARGRKPSSSLVAGPPPEVWVFQQLFRSLVL